MLLAINQGVSLKAIPFSHALIKTILKNTKKPGFSDTFHIFIRNILKRVDISQILRIMYIHIIYVVLTGKSSMNYIEAKSELQKKPPKPSFKFLALEGVAMLFIAGLLVKFL